MRFFKQTTPEYPQKFCLIIKNNELLHCTVLGQRSYSTVQAQPPLSYDQTNKQKNRDYTFIYIYIHNFVKVLQEQPEPFIWEETPEKKPEVSYVCPDVDCKRRFRRKKSLQKHLTEAHKGNGLIRYFEVLTVNKVLAETKFQQNFPPPTQLKIYNQAKNIPVVLPSSHKI